MSFALAPAPANGLYDGLYSDDLLISFNTTNTNLFHDDYTVLHPTQQLGPSLASSSPPLEGHEFPTLPLGNMTGNIIALLPINNPSTTSASTSPIPAHTGTEQNHFFRCEVS